MSRSQVRILARSQKALHLQGFFVYYTFQIFLILLKLIYLSIFISICIMMKRVLLILIFFPFLSLSQVKVLGDIDFSKNEYKLVFTYERAYDTINLISHKFENFVISDKKPFYHDQKSSYFFCRKNSNRKFHVSFI